MGGSVGRGVSVSMVRLWQCLRRSRGRGEWVRNGVNATVAWKKAAVVGIHSASGDTRVRTVVGWRRQRGI